MQIEKTSNQCGESKERTIKEGDELRIDECLMAPSIRGFWVCRTVLFFYEIF